MKTCSSSHQQQATRQGTVLLLVLVVVMLLSFSLYSFSEGMLIQFAATKSSLRQLQLRQLAESGIETASDALSDPSVRILEDLTNNTKRFRNVILTNIDGSSAGFTLLNSFPTDQQPAQFGLADESGRLNINSLPLGPSQRKQSRERLMQLPEMTKHRADAILDWMDSDDDASEYGVESSWYTSQSPPYRPAQARFGSLHELLLVRGFSSKLLFGEDRNQNGILDPGEDANLDGQLQRGLSRYISIDAAETSLQADGTNKIDVNSNNLPLLYDQLESSFDSEAAQFIVAFRMSGLSDDGQVKKRLTEEEKREERLTTARRRLALQLGAGADKGGLKALAESDNVVVESRGGLVLSSSPPHKIRSLVDLIGSLVRVNVNNKDTLLKSPWESDAGSVDEALRELSSKLTVTGSSRLVGRINVFQAPYEVLMTIPEMTESRARSIIRFQTRNAVASQNVSTKPPGTIALLMRQGVADLERLRQMAPYITSGGDVFRGIAIGHIEGVRSTSAIRFKIDATYPTPRLLSLQDLPPMPGPIDSPDEISRYRVSPN